MGCFSTILVVVGGIFMMISLLRWFEQVNDAVDGGQWNRLSLLMAFPFAVWFYESKVGISRPTPVPRHEPVRGFGKAPPAPTQPVESKIEPTGEPGGASQPEPLPPLAQKVDDGPPPGTPPEFLGLPKIPPKKPAQIDAEKIEKLRQKMRQQGMLPPEQNE